MVQNTKLLSFICREVVAVVKEYYDRRHYETKHKFDKEVKQSKLKEFKSQIKVQQKMFGAELQQFSNIGQASKHL